MAAQNVTPTRSELITVKRKIALSQSGYSLLKRKRDGLMFEVFKILPKVKTIREDLVARFREAQQAIDTASALDGALAIRSIAFTSGGSPNVTLREHNIMGVKVPQISADGIRRDISERGYGIVGTSAALDAAVGAYEELLEQILIAAEYETAIKRLLDEVEKTKRRVNALEFKVLPELTEVRDFIKMRLDEMERESLFTTKRIKAKSVA